MRRPDGLDHRNSLGGLCQVQRIKRDTLTLYTLTLSVKQQFPDRKFNFKNEYFLKQTIISCFLNVIDIKCSGQACSFNQQCVELNKFQRDIAWSDVNCTSVEESFPYFIRVKKFTYNINKHIVCWFMLTYFYLNSLQSQKSKLLTRMNNGKFCL